MADKKLTFTVGADVSAGTKGFDQLARAAKQSMGQVDDSLDDTRTAGQRLADALSGELDSLEAAMRGTREAADMLGQALGPELAAKTDTVAAVTKFQKLGLSVDEVKADVNALADVIRRADDVSMSNLAGEPDKVKGAVDSAKGAVNELGDAVRSADSSSLDTLGTSAHNTSRKLGEVHGEADQSRSVLANMVGNTTQDLGELGGVAGSTGVLIGQLGEYAADGNIQVASLVKLAGPMAGLAVGAKLISDAFKFQADKAAESKKRVGEFVDAIREGTPIVEVFRKTLEDTGEFKFVGMGDIRDELGKTNISIAEFADLIKKTPAELEAWAQAQHDAGRTSDELRTVVFAAAAANEDYAKALDEAALNTALLTESTGKASAGAKDAIVAANAHTVALDEESRALSDSSEATATATAASQEFTAEVDKTVTALRDEAGALNAQIDAAAGAADATITASDAHDDFVAAIQETIAAQKDGKKTTEEKTAAVKAERDALINSAKANADLAAKQAEASGSALTATQKVDNYNKSLEDNAAFATPAAQRAAYEYLIQLNQIPADVATDILADVDAGRLDSANGKLNAASAPRTAAIKAEADTATANRILDQAAGTRIAIIRAQVSGGAVTRNNGTGFVQNAGGGDVAAGEPVWVGDKFGIHSPSAELFVPNVPGHVYNQSQIGRAASGSPAVAPGATVVFSPTFNIHAGVGSDARQIQRLVMDALAGYARNNGGANIRRLVGLPVVG